MTQNFYRTLPFRLRDVCFMYPPNKLNVKINHKKGKMWPKKCDTPYHKLCFEFKTEVSMN